MIVFLLLSEYQRQLPELIFTYHTVHWIHIYAANGVKLYTHTNTNTITITIKSSNNNCCEWQQQQKEEEISLFFTFSHLVACALFRMKRQGNVIHTENMLTLLYKSHFSFECFCGNDEFIQSFRCYSIHNNEINNNVYVFTNSSISYIDHTIRKSNREYCDHIFLCTCCSLMSHVIG